MGLCELVCKGMGLCKWLWHVSLWWRMRRGNVAFLSDSDLHSIQVYQCIIFYWFPCCFEWWKSLVSWNTIYSMTLYINWWLQKDKWAQGGVTGGISDTGFGWVGLLGPLFFFLDIKKKEIWGVFTYRLLAQFGHKNWTNQCLVPCGRVLILKVPYCNHEN